jgi:large subunit ribosomal protein L32
MAPLPKRRHSTRRSGKRENENMKTSLPNSSVCSKCKAAKLPHRVCPKCGASK